jgi:hypothetical protein
MKARKKFVGPLKLYLKRYKIYILQRGYLTERVRNVPHTPLYEGSCNVTHLTRFHIPPWFIYAAPWYRISETQMQM